MNPNEFSKSGRIVVSRGFRVTEGFHRRVCRHDLVFQGLFSGVDVDAGGHHREVLDDFFGVNSFSGARLAGDQHGLVVSVHQHVLVGFVGDGVEVRWHFGSSFSAIEKKCRPDEKTEEIDESRGLSFLNFQRNNFKQTI